MNNKIIPFILIFLAAAFGCIYSVYNTDTHHWGFILGTAMDFIHGKNLFSETYIQYGVGEPIFFKLLNYIFPITFTSIGIVASITYAMTFLVLFYGIVKISNRFIASLIVTFALLLHSYAIYPWPDYFAGFFLILSCFLLIGEKNLYGDRKAFFSGIFLFVSFSFRNTYLLSIGVAALAYGVLALIDSRIREKRIFISLSTFGLLLICYLLFLFQKGDLYLWYSQTIGAGTSQYGVGMSHVIARLKEAFFPSGTINALFSIFYYFGFYAVFTLIFKKKHYSGATIFFALLGMAGLIQALLIYEMFRLQNACAPLYFVGAAILYELFPKPENFWKEKKLVYLLIWYFIFFLLRFPHATSIHSFLDGRFIYKESEIPVFKHHRFRAEVNEYYDGLSKLICDAKSKIMNRTMDSIIPYLCPHQTNSLSLSFYSPEMLKKTAVQEVFSPDTLVISPEPFPVNSNVKLVEIGQVYRPEEIQYMDQGLVKVYRIEMIK